MVFWTPIITTKTLISFSLNFHEGLREISVIQFFQEKKEENLKVIKSFHMLIC